MSNILSRIKQDKAELKKRKVTVSSVAVATTKFVFGMCDYTIHSDDGRGDFSHVLGIMEVCGHAHVRSHVSPGMD